MALTKEDLEAIENLLDRKLGELEAKLDGAVAQLGEAITAMGTMTEQLITVRFDRLERRLKLNEDDIDELKFREGEW